MDGLAVNRSWLIAPLLDGFFCWFSGFLRDGSLEGLHRKWHEGSRRLHRHRLLPLPASLALKALAKARTLH